MVNETMSTAEKLARALEPFAGAELTDGGRIVGLMREDFDRARSSLAAYRAQPAEEVRSKMPASAPGAAEHLAGLMRAIATKCRVGYVISKTVNSNIRTAAEISASLNAGFAAAQPAADGAQRVERMSEEHVNRLFSSSEVYQYHPGAVMEFARAIETNLAAAWGVKLDGEAS